MDATSTPNRAVLDLEGATCTSCAIAIEHAGRRIPGVRDLLVDRGTSTIQVEYDGGDEVLSDIRSVVTRLGYEARVRTPPQKRSPAPQPQPR